MLETMGVDRVISVDLHSGQVRNRCNGLFHFSFFLFYFLVSLGFVLCLCVTDVHGAFGFWVGVFFSFLFRSVLTQSVFL